jgi:hypothetical protein
LLIVLWESNIVLGVVEQIVFVINDVVKVVERSVSDFGTFVRIRVEVELIFEGS